MKYSMIYEIIITNLVDLCRFMRKDHIEIVKMIPIKGITNEDIMKVEYRYRKEEE